MTNTTRLIILNICGFLVQVILTIATYQKSKKKYCTYIIASRVPDVPTYFLANDYPSISFSLLGALRAFLTYKEKYTLKIANIFEALIISATLFLNKKGAWVIFPLIGTTISNYYFLFKDIKKIVLWSFINNLIYIDYFIFIENYAGAIMLIGATIAQIPAVINNYKN